MRTIEAPAGFRKLLEENAEFLYNTIPAIGNASRTLLAAYSDPLGISSGYRDRGYGEARQLIDLLSVMSEDETMLSGYFHGLSKNLSFMREFAPAAEKEIKIMSRINEENLMPMKELIYETVPSKFEERGGKLILYPDEFVEILNNASIILQFYEIEAGLSYLRKGVFNNGEDVASLIQKQIPAQDAFGYNWEAFNKSLNPTINPYERSMYKKEAHWNLRSSNESIDTFGLINLAIADAHTGSVIIDALESDDPVQVLINDYPEKGVNELFFDPKINGELKIGMRNDLSKEVHRDTMCTASMIRRRANFGKYKRYINRQKKALKMREEKTQGVV